MKTEPAVVLSLIIGSFFFFFLLLPWALVLARLRRVWESDRGSGLVLGVVVLLTSFFFTLFFAGFAVLTYSGLSVK